MNLCVGEYLDPLLVSFHRKKTAPLSHKYIFLALTNCYNIEIKFLLLYFGLRLQWQADQNVTLRSNFLKLIH